MSTNQVAQNGVKTVSVAESSTRTDDEPERETWGNRAEFLLSCIGLSVGIGNVWRFPYLAYQNGGGEPALNSVSFLVPISLLSSAFYYTHRAFLLPYTILLILIGKPMYFIELAMGQYSGLGPMTIWKCCPIATGVGAAMIVISLIVSIYYTVIIGYTIHYLAASFASEVPWGRCMDWWGADSRCYTRNGTHGVNLTSSIINKTCQPQLETPSEQYWTKYVLGLHEANGIGDIGQIRWDLTLCLLLAWIIVFLCLFKGIKSAGKVVYFTATFPYVILLILLIRGVTLEGAGEGIKYFFIPQWDKLLTINAWARAAEQMFYSLGISWGSLLMFGSYCNFKNKVHVDAMIVSSLDFITSIIAGIVIFSVLGALSVELNRDIGTVIKSGPGLAFVAYPEALARLPVPQLWSVLFFFMLFTLGLDSEFSMLETVLSAVYEGFPKTRRYKPLVCFIACAICFLLGLPCVTSGGQYVLELMNNYGGGFTLLLVGSIEMMAFMWIYGISQVSDNLQYMLGFRPNWFWKICWAGISPVILLALFIIYCIQFEPPTYGCYEYPVWGHGVGWGLLLVSVIQIPLFAIGYLAYYAYKGDWRAAFRPTLAWGPNDGSMKQKMIDFDMKNAYYLSNKDSIETEPPVYVVSGV